ARSHGDEQRLRDRQVDDNQFNCVQQCSYVPPCERDNQKNRDSVLWWEDYFTREVSSQVFTCFFNRQRSVRKRCFVNKEMQSLKYVLWEEELEPSKMEKVTDLLVDILNDNGKHQMTSSYLLLLVFLRPDDVLWRRSHDTSVLLHCVLWPMVSLLLGTLIVLLTVCARSLAVRAEALQKRKFSYEVCQDLSASGSSERRGHKAEDPLTSSDPETSSSPTRTLPLFAVPVRRRDREH
ncbi:hypothetical protein KUCAC02_036291, partial [Chaenocephalus aceratus]